MPTSKRADPQEFIREWLLIDQCLEELSACHAADLFTPMDGLIVYEVLTRSVRDHLDVMLDAITTNPNLFIQSSYKGLTPGQVKPKKVDDIPF